MMEIYFVVITYKKILKMKKLYLLFALLVSVAFTASAQLPDGSTAPDWTLTDINGVEHHLYEYLDSGYTVVIDFSATWCGPCWNYHNSGALEELYINHGPAGMPNVSENTTDDVMVFFIEGDGNTTMADLQGTGGNTQGDWITGTPYPIIDDASMTGPYEIAYWPTIYTICTNKEIQESGQITAEAHYDIAYECAISSLSYSVEDTSPSALLNGNNAHFTFDLMNSGDAEESFALTFTTNAPDDWSAALTTDGADGTPLEVTIAAGAQASFSFDVTPGAAAAIADYGIDIASTTHSDNVHLKVDYSVISGITDLVIDNGDRATQWNSEFTDGLATAENVTNGVIGINKFIQGVTADQLEGVGHLYFNISWTFPSLTNDNVMALSSFLDNGGNLFIAGQDIGWDTWDTASGAANGTAETRAFYTDYLHADYQSDGSGSNNQLNWVEDDPIFGGATNSGINDIYSGNIYPDEIDPIEPAVSIFHYNSASKSGGVRVQTDDYKVVYIGIDLAMIDNEETRNQAIKLSHDWFHGLISGTEFDEALKQAIGENFPNPANKITTIPLDNLQEDLDLNVLNSLGAIVYSAKIKKGSTQYDLDVSNLSAGLYQCVLTNDKGALTTVSIVVTK